jgi:glutathione S-transferase
MNSIQYLADKFGPAPLYPQAIERRADVNRWLSWQMCHPLRLLGAPQCAAVHYRCV